MFLNKKQPLNYHFIILAMIIFVVFLGSLILIPKNGMYVSPDETANSFFAQRFAQTGTLVIDEPLNTPLSNALHPRSMVSIDGKLAPGSFIGLPVIYGSLAAVLGNWVIPYLSPFIAALAVFAFYGVTHKFFNKRIAIISAILLSFHPAWWYYSSRSLMHNILFVSLLVFSVYFLLVRPFRHKTVWLNEVASGLLIGLTIFTRTSEALWVILVLLILGFIYRSKIKWKSVLIFFVSFIIALIPMFILNQATYGSPLKTGYTVTDASQTESLLGSERTVGSIVSPETDYSIRDRIENVLKPAFPFGIHPRAIARNVYSHGLSLFWWLTFFTFIGLILAILVNNGVKDDRLQLRYYTLLFLGVSFWLAVMYGSWNIYDNPDPKAITIGNSYLRYWLPVFVMSVPFVAMGINWIASFTKRRVIQLIMIAALLVVCFSLSIRAVFLSAGDGLIAISQTLERSKEIRNQVFESVPEDAVIIVDRADKIFFPHRRVLQPLRSDKTYAVMPKVIDLVPLYYYGVTLPPEDVEHLNTKRLEGDLQIELIETFDAESLYRFIKK